MMYESIKGFADQFKWAPILENADKLGYYDKFIIAGMGGSHLSADLLKRLKPELNIKVNSDYGLPTWNRSLASKILVIISSYSGNTEEAISAYEAAHAAGLDIAVIAANGKLLERAKENGRPYIALPATGLQPRMATGYGLLALLKLTRQADLEGPLAALATTLDPSSLESEGKTLAEKAVGKTPIIYSSYRNRSLAYIWKIKLNETGKSPAFQNVLPELNHNELEGWNLGKKNESLKDSFFFIFLSDPSDDPRIIKRQNLTKKLLADRGYQAEQVELRGTSEPAKIFSTLILGDWFAYHLALKNEQETEQVPLIEEFKRSLTA